MEVRWVPYSAGLLATGALAMLCGALLTPTAGEAGESLRMVEQNDSRYLLVSVMLWLASFCLTLGLPSVYALLRRDNPRFGLVAVGIFAVGTIAMCGYAVLLVFYRALVLTDLLRGPVDGITSDVGIAAFLGIFLGAFYLGELLIGIALLRTHGVPRWIPGLLIAHVTTLLVNRVLPDEWANFTTALIAFGLCGVAVAANDDWSARLRARERVL